LKVKWRRSNGQFRVSFLIYVGGDEPKVGDEKSYAH